MNQMLRSKISALTLTTAVLSLGAAAAHAQAPAKPVAPKAEMAPKAEAPKAEAPKAEAPKAAPAKAEAPKAAAPVAPPPGAAAPVRKVPPPAVPMPQAPAEIAALAKSSGNWRCTGTAMGPAGEQKMVALVRNRLDVDKWWVRTSFAEVGGGKYKFEAYTTLDAKTGKWHRVMVDNMGGQEAAVSDGPRDGVTLWESTSRSVIGEGMARHHEDLSNPKELKMWGEYSVDKGRTWTKAYEASCKR
jgi:hypothetical protein